MGHRAIILLIVLWIIAAPVRLGAQALPASRPVPKAQPLLRPEPSSYRTIQKEAESLLNSELRLFYPALVDRQNGGFFESRPNTRQRTTRKSLVFQSRMVWTAAEVALRRPDKAKEFSVYVMHGTSFLRDAMWDQTNGGFHWSVDANGAPAAQAKHAYGMAFAIYALANGHLATGDAEMKTLAMDAYRWLEKNGHDRQNGGYYQAFTPAGQIIRTANQAASQDRADFIGTPFGCKAMNAHIHLLEAITTLYRADREPPLRNRLEEMYGITKNKVMLPAGTLGENFNPDWTALDDGGSFGHDVETGFLLLETARELGTQADPAAQAVARKLIDHALEQGWDQDMGGLWDNRGHRSKNWWTQAEAAQALLLMHMTFGHETDLYWTRFQQQWRFITRHMIDPQTRGWFSAVGPDSRPANRNLVNPWKACYHTGRALLNISDWLTTISSDPRPATMQTAQTPIQRH